MSKTMRNIYEGLQEIHEAKQNTDKYYYGRQFKNRQELIDFVKQQLNVELVHDDSKTTKKNLLFTEIKTDDHRKLMSFFQKYEIRVDHFRQNFYYIHVKSKISKDFANKRDGVVMWANY